MNRSHSLLFSLFSLAGLAACGGGGGSPSPTLTPAPAPVATVVVQPSPTPTPAPAPALIYQPGTAEKSASDFLNSARASCGFGNLTPDSRLSTAAQRHASYVFASGQATHAETPGPLFYGADPASRALAAGYPFATGESVYFGYGALRGDAVIATRNLLAAPYHALTMMYPFVHIGVGAELSTADGGKTALVFSFGVGPSTPPPQTQDVLKDVLNFPCDGAQEIGTAMRGESPNPLPGRDLSNSPTGPAIILRGRDGKTPQVTEYSMTSAAGAAVVLIPPITSSTDLNLRPGDVFILPNSPLLPNTQYRVRITGVLNGSAFTKNFTFKTGSAT